MTLNGNFGWVSCDTSCPCKEYHQASFSRMRLKGPFKHASSKRQCHFLCNCPLGIHDIWDYAFSGSGSGKHIPRPGKNCRLCWCLLWLVLSHPLSLKMLWRGQGHKRDKQIPVSYHLLPRILARCACVYSTHMKTAHCLSVVIRDLYGA